MIDLLLQAGADINSINSWKYTPIITALLKDHYDCLIKLTNYAGIDVNCQDDSGMTLVANCIVKFEQSSLEFTRLLIDQRNANPNICDFRGNNCLHILAAIDPDLKVHNNYVSYQQFKAERLELKQMYASFFNLLISGGVEINEPNAAMHTPLIIALQKGNDAFIELLLQLDHLDLKSTPDNKTTILHYCGPLIAMKKGPEFMRVIINKMGSVVDTSEIVNDEGMNHFLNLVQSFTEAIFPHENKSIRCKQNVLNALISHQTNQFSQNLQVPVHPNAMSLNELQAALSKKTSKVNNANELRNNRFISIINIFNELGYDFSHRVATIKKECEDVRAKIEHHDNYNLSMYNMNYSHNMRVDVFTEKEAEEKPADVIVNQHAQSTLLHLLIKNTKLTVFQYVVELLQQKGIYAPNEMNYFGETLWHYFNSNVLHADTIVRYIHELGEDPNIPDANGNYPLILLVESSNVDLVRLLTTLGADINVINSNGTSALIYYTKKRDKQQVHHLVAHGCDINIVDRQGCNALHWAINNNNGSSDATLDLEEFLISNHINVNAYDNQRRNPFHYFFVKLDNIEVNAVDDNIELLQDLLIFPEIEIDNPDEYGRTPLSYAVQRGAYLCVSTLIHRKCDDTRVDMFGNTLFNIALINKHIDVAISLMQKLLTINPDVYIVDYQLMALWKQQEADRLRPMDVEVGMKEIRAKSEAKVFKHHQRNNQRISMRSSFVKHASGKT